MTIDPELGDRERSALDVWEPMTPPEGFADRVLAIRGGRRWLPYVATAITCGAAAAIIATILSRNPGQTLPDATNVAVAPLHEIDAAVAIVPVDMERWYDDDMPGPDQASRDAGGFWVDGSFIPSPLAENQYDVDIEAGETFTVYTPFSIADIRFHVPSCDLVVAEIDRDPKFTTSNGTANLNHRGVGRPGAVVEAELGTWYYRVYCGITTSAPRATGRFTVLLDDGTRKLAVPSPTTTIDPDGRIWPVTYTTSIPDIAIKRVPGGERFHLLDAKGVDRTTFIKDPTVTTITVPGSSLHDGSYSFWFDRGGVKVGLGTTLDIAFDATAPQLSIEEPALGASTTPIVDVRGTSLLGWTIAVDGKTVPTRSTASGLRFSTTANVGANHAVAIKATHAKRGIRYYIRRLF